MCGRFTNRLTWSEIVALYRLSFPATPERNLPARYNICPTDTIDAVIERGSKPDGAWASLNLRFVSSACTAEGLSNNVKS